MVTPNASIWQMILRDFHQSQSVGLSFSPCNKVFVPTRGRPFLSQDEMMIQDSSSAGIQIIRTTHAQNVFLLESMRSMHALLQYVFARSIFTMQLTKKQAIREGVERWRGRVASLDHPQVANVCDGQTIFATSTHTTPRHRTNTNQSDRQSHVSDDEVPPPASPWPKHAVTCSVERCCYGV